MLDGGLQEHSAPPRDRGTCRTPSLRHLEATEPDFHNCSVLLVSDEIRHELEQDGALALAGGLSLVLWTTVIACGRMIGGLTQDFQCSARLGKSPFFVIEADEYDTAFFDKRSKFVHYRPRTLILNNLAELLTQTIRGPRLLLNLKEISFVTSTFLNRLLVLRRKIQDDRGRLLLCDLSPIVQEIFDVNQLGALFDVFPSERDALGE